MIVCALIICNFPKRTDEDHHDVCVCMCISFECLDGVYVSFSQTSCVRMVFYRKKKIFFVIRLDQLICFRSFSPLHHTPCEIDNA